MKWFSARSAKAFSVSLMVCLLGLLTATQASALAASAGSLAAQAPTASATMLTPPTIADSVRDFSGTQGTNGWFYGYYSGALTAATFRQMTVFSGTNMPPAWFVRPGTYWTQLWATGGHPQSGLNTCCGRQLAEQWAVRRWVSNGAGSVTLAGNYAKEDTRCGLGTIGHIVVDGSQIWSRAVNFWDSTGFNYALSAVVHPGSTIDFAISTRGSNDFCDSSHFTATITGDITPPILTLPGTVLADATGPGGALVDYGGSVTATDPGDTVTLSCVPPSGSMFSIGITTVTCVATDSFGNSVAGSFSVHVRGAGEQLAVLLGQVRAIGPGKSLAPKIAGAQQALATGHIHAACGRLTAFVDEVTAQSGKKLTAAQASALIAAAQRIMRVVGCPTEPRDDAPGDQQRGDEPGHEQRGDSDDRADDA